MSAEPRLPATPRRRARARREGHVARSSILTSAATLVAAALACAAGAVSAALRIADFTAHTTRGAFTSPDLTSTLQTGFDLVGALLLPFVIVVFGAALIAGYTQVGALFTTRPLVPDVERLSFRTPGPMAAGWDAARGLLLLFTTALALRMSVRSLLSVSRETLPGAVAVFVETLAILTPPLLAIVLVIGLLDGVFTRMRYEKSLRMTPEERAEERRQTEGDANVKSSLRVLGDRTGGSATTERTQRNTTTGMSTPTGEVEPGD